MNKLKIYAYASQMDAGFVKVGDTAQIWDVARPAEKLKAPLSRTSVQLDARTRTLLLEFDVDNSKKIFQPGSYLRVALSYKIPSYVVIPVAAMVVRSNKTFAMILTNENKVSLRPIVIANSDGKNAQLLSGVEEGEKVILNGGESLADGDPVRPVEGEGR